MFRAIIQGVATAWRRSVGQICRWIPPRAVLVGFFVAAAVAAMMPLWLRPFRPLFYHHPSEYVTMPGWAHYAEGATPPILHDYWGTTVAYLRGGTRVLPPKTLVAAGEPFTFSNGTKVRIAEAALFSPGKPEPPLLSYAFPGMVALQRDNPARRLALKPWEGGVWLPFRGLSVFTEVSPTFDDSTLSLSVQDPVTNEVASLGVGSGIGLYTRQDDCYVRPTDHGPFLCVLHLDLVETSTLAYHAPVIPGKEFPGEATPGGYSAEPGTTRLSPAPAVMTAAGGALPSYYPEKFRRPSGKPPTTILGVERTADGCTTLKLARDPELLGVAFLTTSDLEGPPVVARPRTFGPDYTTYDARVPPEMVHGFQFSHKKSSEEVGMLIPRFAGVEDGVDLLDKHVPPGSATTVRQALDLVYHTSPDDPVFDEPLPASERRGTTVRRVLSNFLARHPGLALNSVGIYLDSSRPFRNSDWGGAVALRGLRWVALAAIAWWVLVLLLVLGHRNFLRQRGYTNLSFGNVLRLYLLVGSRLRILPHADELGTLPGVEPSDVRSLARFVQAP